MAPKKKTGRKKEEAQKEIEFDDDIVPEHSREFYLIQIRDLEGRLARYQKKWDEQQVNEEHFRAEYEKMARDNKEIVAFLKKTLNQRVDELSDLTAQHQNLQVAKDTEKDSFKAQVEQITQEFQETNNLLKAENTTLNGKLMALEEFRLQKEEIMANFAELEAQLKKQKEDHKEIIYNLEKKGVIDKERLKKDMLHRVNAVAAEFKKVAHSQIAETTKRTIRENVALSFEINRITEQSLQLIQENDRLKEAHANTLQQLQLLEKNEKMMASKNVSNQKIIWMLTHKCKELQEQVDEYVQMKVTMDQAQMTSTKLEEQNLVLREDLNTTKKELTQKTADCRHLTTAFQDEQQRRTCAEQVLRHTIQVLKEILAIRPDDDDQEFGMIFLLRRNDVLQGLVNSLSRSIARIESEALQPRMVESTVARLTSEEESDWHLKASRMMSHYNVAEMPKPRMAHSMPSMSGFSRIRAETLRPYSSTTEPLVRMWKEASKEGEEKAPKESSTEGQDLVEAVTEKVTQKLMAE